MLLQFTSKDAQGTFDSSRGIEISIPLDFNGPQPSAFGAPPATSKALELGGFVGDTRLGGSCNCESTTIIPHCNGTHTECVGHITAERVSVLDTLTENLHLGTLISVPIVPASSSGDSYRPSFGPGDNVITRAALEHALKDSSPYWRDALIIRTIPNSDDKLRRNYGTSPAAFFSIEAMQYLCSLGVAHLITDLPSVDRAEDEGKLTTHHIYWGVPEGTKEISPNMPSTKTITELVYVPNQVPDGRYLTVIEIPPFIVDAAPSRIKLYAPRERQ